MKNEKRAVIAAGGSVISIICVFLGWMRIAAGIEGFDVISGGYSLFEITKITGDIDRILKEIDDELSLNGLAGISVISVLAGIILIATAVLTLYTCYREYTGKGVIRIYGFVAGIVIDAIFIIITIVINTSVSSFIRQINDDAFISINVDVGLGAGPIITLIIDVVCIALLKVVYPGSTKETAGNYGAFAGGLNQENPLYSGQQINDAPKFCGKCGAKLAEGARFCPGCGCEIK